MCILQNTLIVGAIALSYPPIVIDDSSWKNAAESFTVALTLTLGGYESAIAPLNIPRAFRIEAEQPGGS